MKPCGQVIQCFINANLAQGHVGLAELAKRYKLDVHRLEPGQFLVFINSRKDKMKIYGANQVLSYIRLEKGRVDLNTIQYLPNAFNVKGKIDYDEALRMRLTEAIQSREPKQDLQVYTSRIAAD